MEIIYLLIGIAIGAVVAFLILKLKSKTSENLMAENKSNYEIKLAQNEEKISNLESANSKLEKELEQSESQKEQHIQRLAKAEVEFANLREKLTSQKQEMEELQKKFTTEFENVANKILEKKPDNDYWREERQWIAGNHLSVLVKQDIQVSQTLGIEEGFTRRRKIGYK